MESKKELFPNPKKEGTRDEVHHPHALMWVSLLIIVAIVIAGGWFFLLEERQVIEPEQTACTTDAKICPDGSVVGRTGPDCEFVCPNP